MPTPNPFEEPSSPPLLPPGNSFTAPAEPSRYTPWLNFDDMEPPSLWGANNAPGIGNDEYFHPPLANPNTNRYPEWWRLRNRLNTRVVAVGAAVLTLMGGGAAVFAPRLMHRASVVSGGEANPPRDLTPITTEVPDRVVLDFGEALAVDKCSTIVSIDGVMSMYQKLFLTQEISGMNLSQLTTRTSEVVKKLDQDRAEQGFIPLPKGFHELQEDAENERAIPVSEYETTAKEFLAKFGVNALFSWNQDASAHADIKDDIAPLQVEGLDANKVIRRRIIDTMVSFASLPPSLIRGTGVNAVLKQLVFGNIKDPRFQGLSLMSGRRTILIDAQDAAQENNIDLAATEAYDSTTPPHEEAHSLYDSICGVILKRNANFIVVLDRDGRAISIDPAFESLNESFKYSKSAEGQLEANQLVGGRYTSHESTGPGSVVVARPYGAENHDEDWATSLGENVLDPEKTGLLLTDKRDSHVLDEKIALEIARIGVNNPEAAEYLVHRFEAARLINTINAVAAPFYKALQDYTVAQAQKGNIDFEQDATYQKLSAAAKKYGDLITEINTATGNIGN